jgi:hypothetical protein
MSENIAEYTRGAQAVLHQFGLCGYAEAAQRIWDAIPNDSEFKAEMMRVYNEYLEAILKEA